MFVIDTNISNQAWDDFVGAQPYTLFVQSSHYRNFYESMGEGSWIWGLKDESGKIVAGSIIVSVHARRGNFLYLPYGPVIDPSVPVDSLQEILSLFFSELKKFARKNNYHFIRVSPFIPNEENARINFQAIGFREAPMHILAEHTWLLNLQPSENELLRDMEKNHRNLIRRCEKEGVRVVIDTSVEALDDFNRLLDVTTKRHNFHRFSRDYIEKEFNVFAPHGQAKVFRAYLADGTLDAAAIFMFHGTMSAYRHGASLLTDKHIPTSYLMQWHAIQEAKRLGCIWHNFWGIAPASAGKTHPFFGITHFKKGFGGQGIDLIPALDLPVSQFYWLNWVVEKFRSIRRGFNK